MDFFTRLKRINSFIYMVGIVAICLVVLNNRGQSQSTLRNPVLEFCTGTWCQWCPCGDSLIINNILPNIPNAIILGYHGAGNDPFRIFHGSSVLSMLGLSAYPTGVVDRVTGVISRSVWFSNMNSRLSVPATVSIDIDRSYDPITREFNAIIDFTALQALSGEYRYKVILVEDGITWAQTSNNTCTPGTSTIPNYIHEWLVRDIMTDASGEMVFDGTWNQNETITKNFNYTVPIPAAPAPDIIPDSCSIVVMVYKQGSPLSSNAEIQQAEEWPLISPDYVATAASSQTDFLGSATSTAQHTIVLKNEGLLEDTYYLNLTFSGPSAWTQSYTTVNGAHGLGEMDSVVVAAGDSTIITVEVSANSEKGYGRTTLDYWSKNSPSVFGDVRMRFATFGLDVLVVDDDENDYEHYFTDELDGMSLEYGVVSSHTVPPVAANLNEFNTIVWLCGATKPTITEDDYTALSTFLDNGGNLYLSGTDVAYELADPASPTYTTGSFDFYTNYLHASYVKRQYTFLLVVGISGDPISGNIDRMSITGGTGASTINFSKGLYPNQIGPGDVYADSIFHFFSRPNDFAAIRAVHNGANGTGGIVFSTFGFESIAEDSNRAKFANNVMGWLDQFVTGIGDPDDPAVAFTFELKPNYPNPFNPSTTISYVLPNIDGETIASLAIYNQLGQKVRTLLNAARGIGEHKIVWDGLDDAGNEVASGIYFYQLRYGSHQATQKMLLLK